jgi:hypothetical protein
MLTLALAWGTLRAASPQPEDDTVTLKDGRVLHGQVVEESNDSVVVLVQGLQRKFGRSFIKKIVYGSGPAEAAVPQQAPMAHDGADGAPAPEAGTIPTAPPKGDLVADLSVRYRVPQSDVIWVRQQGVSDTDLPMVFLVAATAHVVPRAVVKLLRAGWSWDDIEDHFGMNAKYISYEPGPWAAYPYYDYPVGLGWWGGWGWGGGWGYGGHGGGGWGGGYGGGYGGHGGGGGFHH